jgi:hypothetical protein
MAASEAEMRAIFQDIFGTDRQHLTDISERLRLAQRGEKSTIKVDYFSGAENEDPVEWLTAFERAAITNRWNDEARKKALAEGHLRGAAADWFDSVTTAMEDHWNTGTNGDQNFVDLFKARFISKTKKNQWYQELTSLRQQTDESVDSYTNKFKKLVTRVGLTDDAQKKRMFLMGLNPAYTPLVYSQNPADLDATVNSARTIKIGYNFASGKASKDISITTAYCVFNTLCI